MQPLCHVLVRQQTWQEIIISAVVTRLLQVVQAAATLANRGGTRTSAVPGAVAVATRKGLTPRC